MFLVGLTGGIGTGKSTVAKMLEDRGIPVVDADIFARKGSPELTSAFISLRSTHDELFTKRRNSASHGYSIILQKLVESQLVDDNTLTPRQLRKKWENLLKRYRKLKHAANAGIAQYASGSELTFENWPFYKDMDQILVKQEPVSHHMLLPESVSNNSYDYPEEYAVGAKRIRVNPDDCPTVEVVEPQSPSHEPVQVKTSLGPVQVQTRSDVIHRLLNQHERFIALYERLVVALEKFTEFVEPGKPAWRKIKFYFGEEVIKEQGEIDRQRLGQIVFEDVEKRRKLNHIVHPEIYKEIFWVVCSYVLKGYSFVVLDLPLLFEHGAVNCYMHKIIVVTCDKDQQMQRVMTRDSADEAYAKARIGSQWPIEEKAKRANFVVDNSGTLEETEEQVEKMVRILRDDKFHIRLRAFVLLGSTLIVGSVYLFLFAR